MINAYNIRRFSLCFFFVSLVVLSGCLTGPVTVESSVGGDGTIQTYTVEINMSQGVYNYVNQRVRDEGYQSVEVYFRSELEQRIDTNNAERIEYEESSAGDNVSIRIRLEGYTPSERSPISTTTQEGYLVYEDRIFMAANNEQQDHPLVERPLQYTLTMPGEIQNSTADSVAGDTATWHLNRREAQHTRIYAKSEMPIQFDLLSRPAYLLLFVVLIGIALILCYWLWHAYSTQ